MSNRGDEPDIDDTLRAAQEALDAADEVLENYPAPSEISGKVVGFVNSREIIINVGHADGVKLGMQFAVLVPGGVPVSDDETGELLGNVNVAKAVVKIVRVEADHLSVGRTFMSIKGHPARDLRQGLERNVLEQFWIQPAVPDRIETFRAPREETVRAGVDLRVQKGDEVRLTTGDEFIFPG